MKTQTLFFTLALLVATMFTANAKSNKLANSTLKSKPALVDLVLDKNETAIEKLTIENWMTDNNYWGISESLLLESKGEKPKLTIEDWMISDSYWRVKPYKSVIAPDRSAEQQALSIEKWMTDDSYWR